MKRNILKSLFISLILVMGVSNAWAASEGSSWYDWASSENVYFDNTNSSYSNVSMLIGRQWNYSTDAVGSSGVNFTKISNTNNLYHAATTWNHYNTLLFIDATGWGWEGKKVTERYSYAPNYTNTNNVNINGTELFYAASNAKGATLNHQDLTSYTALNYTQTVQQHLSTDGGSSYAASTAVLATVKVASYKLNSKNSTASNSDTIASGKSSTTCSAARTATVTYTVSGVKTGYTFVGWYDGTTQKSTSTTYTYNAVGIKTITARFKENTHTVTISNDGNGTTSPSGAQSNVGQVTGISIIATPAANYEFVNWTLISGSGLFSNANSAQTTFKPASTATIQANFRSTATYHLDVQVGEGIASVTGSTDPVALGGSYAITASPKTGYTFNTWTAEPAANATFADATSPNTNVTILNGSVVVTASATEILSTLTTNNTYNEGSPNYGTPTTSKTQIGVVTSATITATTPDDAYTFSGWTLTNCTRIDEGPDDTLTITIRSNGDGLAATAVANYQKLDSVTIYFRPTNAWKEHNAWFAVYYWNDKKNGWVSMEDGDGHGKLYKAELPGGYSNLIFVRLRPSSADGYTSNNSGLDWGNQWEQTSNLTIPTDDNVLYDMLSTTITHLYLKPNEWVADNAWFATYLCNGSDESSWHKMSLFKDNNDDNAKNDIYCVKIGSEKLVSDKNKNIIFVRMNPNNSNLNWDQKWNQTGDLDMPTDGANFFSLNDNEWSKGSWSTIYDDSKWTIYNPNLNEEEQIVYLKPTGYWNNDNPTFVAHVWNNSSNEDIPMTAVGSEYYTCIIPEGYHSILFFRKSTDGKDIWNQTSDLTIPAHRANCYTIKSTGEGTTKKATGKWNELMLRRRHHNATQQVYDTTGIDIVNSTITFHKDIITNSELSVYERSLYWISFPFDITLNNAFGFGNYGEHWIIEYYDGAERAEKGLWSDASYWKYITDPNYTLKAGVGYVLCLDIDAIIRDDFFNTTDNISLYFPSNNVNLITQITVPEHICDVQRPTEDRSEEDSNWNIIGVPSYTDIANLKNGTSFYYQWNATDNTYTTQDASASTFQVMHAYMVQFAGTIDWAEASVPAQIAARRNTASKDQYTLRLALQQEQQELDHTFIRLQAEDATSNFDLNTDLTKIINNKTSLYSLIDDTHEAAANVLPMQAATIPLGIEVATDGDYTLSMPDGTDGISAILLDYQMGTQTNMLLSEYKITLEAGIYTNRFALIVDPQQTATEIGHPHINASDDVHKYIINGQLFIQSGGNTYDIQGRRVK